MKDNSARSGVRHLVAGVVHLVEGLLQVRHHGVGDLLAVLAPRDGVGCGHDPERLLLPRLRHPRVEALDLGGTHGALGLDLAQDLLLSLLRRCAELLQAVVHEKPLQNVPARPVGVHDLQHVVEEQVLVGHVRVPVVLQVDRPVAAGHARGGDVKDVVRELRALGLVQVLVVLEDDVHAVLKALPRDAPDRVVSLLLVMHVMEAIGELQHPRTRAVELLVEVHALVQKAGEDAGEGAQAADRKVEHKVEGDLQFE
eukprot:UN3628